MRGAGKERRALIWELGRNNAMRPMPIFSSHMHLAFLRQPCPRAEAVAKSHSYLDLSNQLFAVICSEMLEVKMLSRGLPVLYFSNGAMESQACLQSLHI